MNYPVLLGAVIALASFGPAAAQFYYDPDGPPLVYYTPRPTWPVPVNRPSHGRAVAVPAWSADNWRQREEPPVPASQYSLTN